MWAAWGSIVIFLAMPTSGLYSMGLVAVCLVVPCEWSMHSGLDPIGHECATD